MEKEINPCVVCISQNAHSYINEFINHYLELGFKHIYLIDTNLESNKYIIDNENVTIIKEYGQYIYKVYEPRGLDEWYQNELYKQTIEKIWVEKKYNYVLIIDDDEWLTLNNIMYNNIYDLLNNYKNSNNLCFTWYTVTDTNFHYLSEIAKNKKLIDIYTEYYPNLINIKSLYNIDISYEKLQSILNTRDTGFMHNSFMFGQKTYININEAKLIHIRTQCMEQYIITKTKYNYNGYTGGRENFVEYYYLSNYKNDKSIEDMKILVNKYNVQLTDRDKSILGL